MRILADENIPKLGEYFSPYAQIKRKAGRLITAEDVKNVDALLVRSVTAVNAQLLEGSSVRFVGTCTIGTDHLDIDYLNAQQIAWSNAPGCNARGVVDYILSSLSVLAERTGTGWPDKTFGIVGVGQVGGRLAQVLKNLGLKVLLCDPPRARCEGWADYVSLPQIIEHCDVICLHTPLTKIGKDATWHLLNGKNLLQLKPNAWLLNASRGPVIDNQALAELVQKRSDIRLVLDVWEHEPLVDMALLAYADIATPHIAGYSLDGKIRGTEQICHAFARHFALPMPEQSFYPKQSVERLVLSDEASFPADFYRFIRLVYDVRTDDSAMRLALRANTTESAMAQAFDALRKNYPIRREIPDLKIDLLPSVLRTQLQALGIVFSS
ncbi:4-phosphoerythronate dehydrogenase PdxB [Pseudomonas sp. F1_0610]|uniref:4-phosphoerythronate dehydrogenase PdxB n=1 Tax=Pseudomonas sp. F1_0610 TaxID=3114284 RepID=UPI0039C07DA8